MIAQGKIISIIVLFAFGLLMAVTPKFIFGDLIPDQFLIFVQVIGLIFAFMLLYSGLKAR